MNTDEVASCLAALGNVTRLEIYRILVRAGRPGLPVAGVQAQLEIPGSTLSHHLRKLRDVGLVTQTREGTRLICHADFARMESTFSLFLKECCADEQAARQRSTDDTACC
ncbi:metalloregulator ArsR/SmtB family transcription factor [Planctomycetota bacterium]|nr:metalloregulator ArsR/SmtB family transcription factor [Planctomycetota bacterium]